MNAIREIKIMTLLTTLSMILIIAITFLPSTDASAGVEKVDVCHVTNVPEVGDGHVISIAYPAFEAHEKHGDRLVGDPGVTVDADGRTCHISIEPVAPDAVDDQVTTPVDTPVTIDVLANDIFDPTVYVSVQVFPQHGILGIVEVGTFEYTPNAGFVGTDSFIYQICDTASQCDTATVTITVGP